jgi:hypothetical protein
MRDRHAVLKEKWENDRVLEVGEAGTVSAAAKDFWDQFDAEVSHCQDFNARFKAQWLKYY